VRGVGFEPTSISTLDLKANSLTARTSSLWVLLRETRNSFLDFLD